MMRKMLMISKNKRILQIKTTIEEKSDIYSSQVLDFDIS